MEWQTETPANSVGEQPPTPANEGLGVLLLADLFACLAGGAWLLGTNYESYRIVITSFFGIAAVVCFLWSCRLLYKNSRLSGLGQFIFGVNALPFALLFAPITLGVSVIAVLIVIAISKSLGWRYFKVGAACSFVVLAALVYVLFGRIIYKNFWLIVVLSLPLLIELVVRLFGGLALRRSGTDPYVAVRMKKTSGTNGDKK